MEEKDFRSSPELAWLEMGNSLTRFIEATKAFGEFSDGGTGSGVVARDAYKFLHILCKYLEVTGNVVNTLQEFASSPLHAQKKCKFDLQNITESSVCTCFAKELPLWVLCDFKHYGG